MATQPLVDTLASRTRTIPEQQTLAHERERALQKALQKLEACLSRNSNTCETLKDSLMKRLRTTLGINVGTVKSRLARGRQELRRRLEGSL